MGETTPSWNNWQSASWASGGASWQNSSSWSWAQSWKPPEPCGTATAVEANGHVPQHITNNTASQITEPVKLENGGGGSVQGEHQWSSWGSAAGSRAPRSQSASPKMYWNQAGSASWNRGYYGRASGQNAAGERPSTAGPGGSNNWDTGQIKWQDDFTGGGAMPLKGKHINDEIIEKRGAGEILQILDEQMLEFSVVNSVTALHRIAKTDDAMRWKKDPRIKYLNRRILKMFMSSKKDDIDKKETGRRVPGDSWVYYIDTRSLTNAAWAFAKLDLKNDDLIAAISEEIIKKIYDTSPQQLANSAWAFGKMLKYDEHMMTAVAEEVIRRLQEFNGQHIMNTVWACAKLGFLHVDLMSAVSEAAQGMLDDFTPQHLSITAWAYATLGFRDLKLMDAIAEEVLKTLRAFRPQNIANTAWAFATLDYPHRKLLDAISKYAISRFDEYNQQHMSNLLWAFAALQIFDLPLMDAIAEQVMTRAQEFDPQGLSNIACSFALLDYHHQGLFEAVSVASLTRIRDFNPRDLENLAWAYAKLKISDRSLFDAISKECVSKINDFNSLDLSNTAYAYANLGIKDERLMEALAEKSIREKNNFPPLAMACISWAYSTLGINHEALFNAIAEMAVMKIKRIDLQFLVTLVDVEELPCQHDLGRRLGAVLYHILEALPRTPEAWRDESYTKFLYELKIDGFGAVGTRFMYSRMGIDQPSEDFKELALQQLRNLCSRSRIPGAGRDIFAAFAEYEFEVPGCTDPSLHGSILKDLGDPAPQRWSERGWLVTANQLKVGTHLNRARQPTYAIFEELCCLLDKLGAMGFSERRSQITGKVRLLSTAAPCVGCIGAMCQFRQLLPQVVIEAEARTLGDLLS